MEKTFLWDFFNLIWLILKVTNGIDNPHFLSSDVSSPFNSFTSIIAGSKDKSEEPAEDVSEVMSQDPSEDMSGDHSGVTSKDPSEDMSGDQSEVMFEDLSEVMSEDQSKDWSGDPSEDMSRDLSD